MKTQQEMANHDEKMWKLYIDLTNALARAAQREDTVATYWAAQGTKKALQYSGWNITRMEEDASEARARADALRDALNTHEEAYTGWARFWAVPDGHIHSSTNCSTCNNGNSPTKFYLMHEVSGMDEAAAVAARGAFLCTICFPSAPVSMTNGYELLEAAKKAAQCPGSGTYYDSNLPHRKGYAYGNWATCPNCGDRPALTSTHKLRTHKPKEN